MKLTKERIDSLAKALRGGAIIRWACVSSGICEKTYFNWQNEFSDGKLEPFDPDETLDENPSREDLLRYFVRETAMALNDYSSGLLEKIHQADSWQAAAWILERRFPEEFGRRAATQQSESADEVHTESETTEQTEAETGEPEDNPSHPNYNGRPPNGTFETLARRWDKLNSPRKAGGRSNDKMPEV